MGALAKWMVFIGREYTSMEAVDVSIRALL